MMLGGLAWRNLRRRPARSLLAVTGVALGMAAFVMLHGVSTGLERSWVDGLRQQGTDVLGVQRGMLNILTATLDETLGLRMQAVSGVAGVAGELLSLVELDTGDVILASGWQEGTYVWQRQPLLRGRMPGPDEPHGAAVGEPIAETLGLRLGDAIGIAGHPFVVTGVLGEDAGRSPRMAVVPLRTLQRVLGKPGVVTVFSVALQRPDDPQAVAEACEALARAAPAIVFSPAARVADGNRLLRVLRAFTWAASAVALALALVLVVNTLLMSVLERTPELGLLTAVGWSRRRIAALLACEGAALSLVGALLGALAGAVALRVLSSLPQVAGTLITEVHAASVARTVAAMLVLSVLSSAYPAFRAARLPAVESLRSE